MKKNHIIILGGNIIGLYSALKCIELGYHVSIIEKKSTFGNIKYKNYNIFNKNHQSYINLLNKFHIGYSKYNISKHEKLDPLIIYIINKSKLLPKKTLTSQSFAVFCKNLLSASEYDILKTYIDDFENIYSNITTMDCINMLTYDLNYNQEYYKLDDDINILISKIIEYLMMNGVTFVNNTEIKDFKYLNNMFNLYSYGTVFMSNSLIVTLSKKNLFAYKFWNKEQKHLLNYVSTYNIDVSNIYKIIHDDKKQDMTREDDATRYHILHTMHITFPNTNKTANNHVYLWNIGANNIIIREKIKYLYNPHMYLCSESYTKNQFFINYSLETFDCNISRIAKMCSNLA